MSSPRSYYQKLTPIEQKKLKKSLYKILVSALLIGLAVLAIYLLLRHFGITDITPETLQEYIAGFGVAGPIIFIVISFLQVTFIPIPSSVTIIAGSFLFGTWLSFAYSLIGIIAGSFFAFFLGRIVGQPFVRWLAGDQETVDKYIKKMRGKEGVTIFFMFLFPFFPDDFICALAGILPISWFSFAIMQFITRPTSILGNLLFLSGEFLPYDEPWGLTLIIILCLIGVALFVFFFIKSDLINTYFDRFTTWIKNKMPWYKHKMKTTHKYHRAPLWRQKKPRFSHGQKLYFSSYISTTQNGGKLKAPMFRHRQDRRSKTWRRKTA